MGRGKHQLRRETICFRFLPEIKEWIKSKNHPNSYVELLLQKQKDFEEQTLKKGLD
jgi:hypothetical protein